MNWIKKAQEEIGEFESSGWRDDVDQLVESFINGNLTDVIDELYSMPQDRALAVAVYVADSLPEHELKVFMRMLSDRV